MCMTIFPSSYYLFKFLYLMVWEFFKSNYFAISSYTYQKVKINMIGDSPYWWGYEARRTLIHWLWEFKLVWPPCQSVCRNLKNIVIDLSQDATILLLCIYPKVPSSSWPRQSLNHGHWCSVHYIQKLETILMSTSTEE